MTVIDSSRGGGAHTVTFLTYDSGYKSLSFATIGVNTDTNSHSAEGEGTAREPQELPTPSILLDRGRTIPRVGAISGRLQTPPDFPIRIVQQDMFME